MPIRNPFRRAPGALDVGDENQRPTGAPGGFQRAKAVGVKPIDIKEPAEYKLSGMFTRSNTFVFDHVV